ncbi:DotH/IcmK family type IV secretion protein, partial [Pseudomonas savastanoi]
GYAWADETVSPEAAPAKSAVPPSAPVTPAAGAAPSGWATGVGVNPAAQKAGSPAQGNGHVNAAPAQQPSGNDPLPPPPSELFQKAQDSVSPLTPQEIRQLRGQVGEVDKAMAAQQVAIVPRISAQTVNLSPGASLPLVRTAVNYPTSLTFIDSTGAPWKLGAAPISGNPDITPYYVPNSPVMVLYAEKPFASGNVTVYLEGLAVPIMLNVSSGESDTKAQTWTVDSRLDLRVPRRGPGAQPGAAPEVRIGLHDRVLQG